MTETFKVGDLVAFKRTFLQSVGWYTDVPIDGRVVEVGDPPIITVLWCDRDEPVRVNAGNLILKSELHLEAV